jgi:hypothetical protein
MTRGAILGLMMFLVGASLLNAFLTQTRHRSWEIFPMTSWQMFSGRAKQVARTFVVRVIPEEGAKPVEVDERAIFNAEFMVPEAVARRMLNGIVRSAQRGCPDYRLANYRECARKPSCPWQLPEDLSAAWLEAITQRLRLAQPPAAVHIVAVDFDLQGSYEDTVASRREAWTLQWQPRQKTVKITEQQKEEDL